MIFLVYLLLFSTCYYSAMLLWFTIGNVFFNNKTITNQTKPVSIIIAIRNEHKTLNEIKERLQNNKK